MFLRNTGFCNYSLDLTLCNYSCFKNWKFISVIRFDEVEDSKGNTRVQLHWISKEELQRCFDQWKTLWSKKTILRKSFILCWRVPVAQWLKCWIATLLFVSLISSCTITFSFGLIPLGKIWAHFSPHRNGFDTTAVQIDLALNNQWRAIKQRNGHSLFFSVLVNTALFLILLEHFWFG